MRGTWVQSLGLEDPLEKEMETHSSILAWKTPWTEEPGRLQSMGPKESDTLSDFTFTFLASNQIPLCTSKAPGFLRPYPRLESLGLHAGLSNFKGPQVTLCALRAENLL